jgi:hypothetical protein
LALLGRHHPPRITRYAVPGVRETCTGADSFVFYRIFSDSHVRLVRAAVLLLVALMEIRFN